MPVKKSAGAVVFYRNPDGKIEYLLLKHSERYWNFPKGGIEEGESEISAAKREVEEEAGLKDITIVPGFKANEKYIYRAFDDYRGNKDNIEASSQSTYFKTLGDVLANKNKKKTRKYETIFKLVAFYLVESKTKDVKISFEHQNYEWLDFENATERLKRYKGSKEVLRKANEFILNSKR